MTTMLRFANLKERGVVNSWPQLKRLQQLHQFPLGRMLSPNIRAWTGEEVDAWIASRPIENTSPFKGAVLKRIERRNAAQPDLRPDAPAAGRVVVAPVRPRGRPRKVASQTETAVAVGQRVT